MNYESVLNYVMYLDHFMNYEYILIMLCIVVTLLSRVTISELRFFFLSPIRLRVTSLTTLISSVYCYNHIYFNTLLN